MFYNDYKINFSILKHFYCFIQPFPSSATTLHFEFYAENPTVTESAITTNISIKKIGQTNYATYIHIEGVDKLGKTPAQIMNDLLKIYNVPQDRQVYFL